MRHAPVARLSPFSLPVFIAHPWMVGQFFARLQPSVSTNPSLRLTDLLISFSYPAALFFVVRSLSSLTLSSPYSSVISLLFLPSRHTLDTVGIPGVDVTRHPFGLPFCPDRVHPSPDRECPPPPSWLRRSLTSSISWPTRWRLPCWLSTTRTLPSKLPT